MDFVYQGIGGKQAPAACLTSTKLVFTGTSGFRGGVVIQAYASPVYVKVVNKGGTDPVPSSTDYHYPIPASSAFPILCDGNVDVYAQSAGNVSGFEVYT